MKIFLWLKQQGMRFAVFVLKDFPTYFFCRTVKKLSRLKEKKESLIPEASVPNISKNRRIVSIAGTNSFLFYLRSLRDSFPDDDRFRFAWGGFQASGSQSLLVFPDLIKNKKILITMENPVLGRPAFDQLQTRDKGYFRVALYDSAMFHRGIFNIPLQADATRFNNIMRTTKTRLKPYRKKGNHILYALQVPYDRSLVGVDMFTAAQYDLVALRMRTSRKIIVTVNPAMIRELWASERVRGEVAHSYDYLKELCRSLDIEVYDKFQKQGQDSSRFFKDCWCVVCHSSGVALDAVLAGVPAIALHPASFVYPICSHALSEIENPKMPDRIPWLSRLAYCQWTLAEIENGDVWRHFQPSIEGLLEKK